MGAYIMVYDNYLLFFIALLYDLSPAFAPRYELSRLKAAFFVSEISLIQGLPRFFTQPKSS